VPSTAPIATLGRCPIALLLKRIDDRAAARERKRRLQIAGVYLLECADPGVGRFP
jgi:hypothetical protein